MRPTPLRRALALAGTALILSTSAVYADNVQNDIVAGGNDTITAGESTTVNYRITANNGDGQTGCNAADSSSAGVTINVPAGVTATPASLSFTSCGTDKPVVFSSSTAGDYEITISVSDSGAGTYNVNPAKFTLHVNAATPPTDTTPPVITPVVVGTLGENGWYVSNVTVSWTVEDGESAVSSTSDCDSTTLIAETTGVTLTCMATSAGGTASESVTIKIDKTGPVVGALTPSGTAGANGWFTSDVSVSLSGTDAISDNVVCTVDGVASPKSFSSETASTAVAGECTNDAGLSTAATGISIKIDKTAPTGVALTPTGSAGTNGWYVSDVSVAASGTDNVSGPVSCTVDGNPTPKLLTGDTDGVIVNGACTNGAGLSASASSISLKIDQTDPTASITAPTAVNYLVGSTVLANYSCGDATLPGSGLLSCLGTVASGAAVDTTPGSHNFSVTATDNAGNTGGASLSYGAQYGFNGFLSPVDNAPTSNTAKAGSTIPLKWQLWDANGYVSNLSIINLTARGGISCATIGASGTDAIEAYSTGQTVLRYDSTANQYVFNWQTAKSWAGLCGKVTLTYGDGTSHDAYFQFK